ncbi:hypothetical protein PHYPSEUDO_014655 [Phytophthora pseudosyringae]|uniref:Uncharacterized protein n=1 Tax=Phytophthora pseudosyringae TaxID=221518 RepID=A0A8T1W141_9STRA|nr:hypothetical protein PHYPSEUDO_014655 [Phytophthora pseudosyringae]
MANHGFWVRVGFASVSIGCAGALQHGFWLDPPPFSPPTDLHAGYVGVGIATAEIWAFPVLFYMFSLGIVTACVILMFVRAEGGSHAFRHLFSQRQQLRIISKMGLLQVFLYVAYPVYQLQFSNTNDEAPLLLVRPVFKLVIKKVFAAVIAHKEDMIPVRVVFTVDFFDALYLVTFMQTVSLTTLVIVLVVDIGQSAVELEELHRHRRRLLTRIGDVAFAGSLESTTNAGLLDAIRALCSSSRTLQRQGVSVRPCIHHQNSTEGSSLLTKLETAQWAGTSPQLLPSASSIAYLSARSGPIGSCTALAETKKVILPQNRIPADIKQYTKQSARYQVKSLQKVWGAAHPQQTFRCS